MPLRENSQPINVKAKPIDFQKLLTAIPAILVLICMGMVAYGVVNGSSPFKAVPTPTALPIAAAMASPSTPTPGPITATPTITATPIPTSIATPAEQPSYTSQYSYWQPGHGPAVTTTSTPIITPTPTTTPSPMA
ncbi:hypothetical protein MCP_2145 [Methanocella paludicola SANAE]|uniref:Uncharacterized protein n=1 Tax=Methanocella paludicola (strain DSM 17711 / JCM 13418 / NBRC 101707 / SANAE) TaxID=304371 RepID=D1Z0J5_METPS|nr:hypothetical protein [Methanocella paludicola]BAI62217.1 hypothetical protein MCP_2145 [Methanocella paludicola SANAE]